MAQRSSKQHSIRCFLLNPKALVSSIHIPKGSIYVAQCYETPNLVHSRIPALQRISNLSQQLNLLTRIGAFRLLFFRGNPRLYCIYGLHR